MKKAPWERCSFLFTLTFVGGYTNAYTYVTRNGILANMHTANMSKLGISIADGMWRDALFYLIPIVACILGAMFSEAFKKKIEGRSGDWRKYALLLESFALILLGWIPLSSPDLLVTVPTSFFMGYQLCLFRSFNGSAHNTTICTGNLRNVGQLLFAAFEKRTTASFQRLGAFSLLTFSFVIGSIPGTYISHIVGTKSVWICAFLLIMESVWMFFYERNLSLKLESKDAEGNM